MIIEKSNNQIEAIIFKKDEKEKYLFLMLKRNEDKGGFWQPMTGGVHVGESFEEALDRELAEETGVYKCIRSVDTGYSFEFFDNNRKQLERVFGVEVDKDTEIKLSDEHTEMKWVTKDEAIKDYLKWDGNKEGLRALWEKLNKIVR